MQKDNLLKTQRILSKQDIECWLMYSAEHSDPYFEKIIAPNTITPAIAIISPNKCFAMVHKLDADNVEKFEGLKVLPYEESESLWLDIEKILKSFGWPEKIALNYSGLGDINTDVLGYGAYKYLTNKLRHLYGANKKKIKFISADDLLYAFSAEKSAGDIEKMKIAAGRALEIMEQAFGTIVPGMTEIDVVKLVHKITEKKPACFKEQGVVNEEFSWEEEICPIVLAGPSLKKGGHSSASDQKVERGFTVYMDFGVKLTFEDGSKWSSDLQRMGYVLEDGEKEAPESVRKVFETLIRAIDLGIKKIRPGIENYKVDEVVRDYILKAGYPGYNHSTGHPIGENAHGLGVRIAPKIPKTPVQRIVENGAYTIEPRIAIKNGGSIEEMVLVTKKGGVPLCSPQKELYLIK